MPYITEGPTGESATTDVARYLLGLRGASGFGSSSTAAEVARHWDGKGKVVIVTGSNKGLGKEAARVLASRGAEVIIAVRDTTRGEAAAKDIRAQHADAKVTVIQCDLSSLKSVKSFAADFTKSGKQCHVLIANAGVMSYPFALSADNHELIFSTNHLGHFLLVNELLPVLKRTGKESGANSRVVVLSSSAHFQPYKAEVGGPIRFDAIDSSDGYDGHTAYGQSKLCNVLFARELHRRLSAEGAPVTAAVCHPGVIMTELAQYFMQGVSASFRLLVLSTAGWCFKSVAQGAATEVYLATSPDVKGGEYYADCGLSPSTAASHDDQLGRKLWEFSEKLVAQAGL